MVGIPERTAHENGSQMVSKYAYLSFRMLPVIFAQILLSL